MLLVVLVWVITIFFFISGNAFWKHKTQAGAVFLILALGLTFTFFRKRKIVFTIIMLTFILVNVGLTAAFHPSVLGYLLTVGSAGGLYLIVRLMAKKYPYPRFGRKQMHMFFDHDPE